MNINLPPKVRLAIYLINGFGAPLMTYLLAINVIGQLEVALWAAEMTFAFALAGLNVEQ